MYTIRYEVLTSQVLNDTMKFVISPGYGGPPNEETPKLHALYLRGTGRSPDDLYTNISLYVGDDRLHTADPLLFHLNKQLYEPQHKTYLLRSRPEPIMYYAPVTLVQGPFSYTIDQINSLFGDRPQTPEISLHIETQCQDLSVIAGYIDGIPKA